MVSAPGCSSRTSTPGARSWTSRRNVSGGSRRNAAPDIPSGWSEPQWIGITILGLSRRTASAARSGSRWPSPRLGPQPQIGRSATSSGSARPCELGEEVGVAREVDGAAAPDEEPDRGAGPAVQRRRRLHREPADRALVTRLERIDCAPEAAAAERPDRTMRREDRHALARAGGASGRRGGRGARGTGAPRRSARPLPARVAAARFADARCAYAGSDRSGAAFRRARAAPSRGRPT